MYNVMQAESIVGDEATKQIRKETNGIGKEGSIQNNVDTAVNQHVNVGI